MSEPRDIELNEENEPRIVEMPRPRAVGSPLAVGISNRTSPAPVPESRQIPASQGSPVPPELTPDDPPFIPVEEPASDQPSSLQRAIHGLRSAWPFVQKILPLLDGQVITAVSNLLTPHPSQNPPVKVNLVPLENGLTELQSRHTELRAQVAEQNTSLKRVEDRLESVREATDRNTLEQQELMQDLKSVGRKVNWVAGIAMVLLLLSVAVNVLLYLQIKRVLP
jgi:hypothetical protein